MTGKRRYKRVLVGVRLPMALARRLKVVAARRGTTVQALIEEAAVALLRSPRRSEREVTRGQE